MISSKLATTFGKFFFVPDKPLEDKKVDLGRCVSYIDFANKKKKL